MFFELSYPSPLGWAKECHPVRVKIIEKLGSAEFGVP
jgi:hypothetical protein